MSSKKKPVVVYGASGYTGRLVCEYLREYGIPFIAAGRSEDKLHAAMKSNVAGIETASYEVVEVIHTVEALSHLFQGASVVLNTVGPFAKFGPEVVEACLAAGCHYTDTTGEQDWLISLDEQFGAKFAAAGLLLSPGLAHMYTTGEIAAQLCLETPGLDTLDIAVFWGGSPTIASTQTILVNVAMAKAYHLEQNQYVEWPADAGLYSLAIPGQHEAALALPWGGTSHPVWFKRDPRVANVKVLGGVFNKPLMQAVPQIVAAAVKATEGMNADDRYAALAKTAAGVMNSMPPRENPRINKSLDSVHASGPLGRAHCVIHGNCNYKQTGLLQAFAAASLLQQAPKRVGFASGCQAFGHHELLGALRSFGLVMEPVLTRERVTAMRLVDYLDKGAQLGAASPCLTMGDADWSYAEVQGISHRVGRGLWRAGIAAGDKVAVLSSNDATAFACVFGISRAGAVWCPINPRNEASENRFVLDAFDCAGLLFHSHYAPMVEQIRAGLPKLVALVCLDKTMAFAPSLADWLDGVGSEPLQVEPIDDIAMIAGTGGTTGQPKGVMLTGGNLETMSALTLMGYPFDGRPAYLALAPLTHAAGVLCLPVMALGGRIVILPKPDLDAFLAAIERHRITHTFLPPTLIYTLLQHPKLAETRKDSLQCFWYGAAPISAARLEDALTKIGPVMAQLFGQTEAPMMISMMAPKDHFNHDGSVARKRLSSAGRPGPLVQVATMTTDGDLLPTGQTGEIVVRSSLVMAGYYRDERATAEAGRHGWHHTGDIGYLDDDGFLFIVDRAKDMIITGGFNVYSVEVEQALMQHPDVQDSAVIGLPDEKWGERVVAVLQLHDGRSVEPSDIQAFVKARIGSVKAPKQVEIWPDLPRSKVGKVLKKDIRNTLLESTKP